MQYIIVTIMTIITIVVSYFIAVKRISIIISPPVTSKGSVHRAWVPK